MKGHPAAAFQKTPSLWRVARAMSRCRPKYPRRAGLFRFIRALRITARNLARKGALPYSLPLFYCSARIFRKILASK